MSHAITVGDLVLAIGVLIALVLGVGGVVGVRNYLSYRRAIKAYQNRPYDPEEG